MVLETVTVPVGREEAAERSSNNGSKSQIYVSKTILLLRVHVGAGSQAVHLVPPDESARTHRSRRRIAAGPTVEQAADSGGRADQRCGPGANCHDRNAPG